MNNKIIFWSCIIIGMLGFSSGCYSYNMGGLIGGSVMWVIGLCGLYKIRFKNNGE
jgi:hypothetical protein